MRLTLNRKQEGLVQISDGSIQPLVTSGHEGLDLGLSDLGVPSLEGGESGSHHDGSVLSVVTVLGEEISHLHVDELEHLVVVDLQEREVRESGKAGKEGKGQLLFWNSISARTTNSKEGWRD